MMSSVFLRRFFSRTLNGPWNFIAGERCSPVDSSGTMKVTEPATGQLLCDIPISGPNEIDRAVSSAKAAFKDWSNFSPRERGNHLTRAAEIIKNNLEDIASLEVKDTGKAIWEARIDVSSCADAFEYYGGIAPTLVGQHIPLPNGSFAYVTREPYGVVAGIGAWNFPIQTCVWKAAPALASGNTFVYKPSQFTPVNAVVLGEILDSAGVLKGAYNVVQGEGDSGSMLCDHPDVGKLSFTGSVSTGTKVMNAGAKGIKAVTLELGGKSPLVIFEDADIVNSVKGALMANFLSQGQVCSNGTRVFVHKKILKPFTELLLKQTKKLKIGDPFQEDVTVGATIHEAHARKVLQYIEEAKKEGAKVLYGGERIQMSGKFSEGWYLSPCILTNVNHTMKVVEEEVFGSVLCLLEFESEEEAIQLANQTRFGLAGAVFTKDIQRAHRVSKQIEAGSVWINTYNLYPTEVPFGGYKMSGIGRENGTWSLDNFTQTKTVYVEMGDVDCGPLYSED
ncbi:4-trimethylaminobutyraldehyde dehydrogenase [Armadillidium nasatum]|uniref:4-trimethylaminobutyraldehyde dehydrogenase n=1 Tax=Armadillidium nasatum TaxID=96803 RepID=A0A5N5TDQ5_9CRUS|nr:4-trimethylaminobutyraldehyde dehydrogenase [Armadillidium nasatum]